MDQNENHSTKFPLKIGRSSIGNFTGWKVGAVAEADTALDGDDSSDDVVFITVLIVSVESGTDICGHCIISTRVFNSSFLAFSRSFHSSSLSSFHLLSSSAFSSFRFFSHYFRSSSLIFFLILSRSASHFVSSSFRAISILSIIICIEATIVCIGYSDPAEFL